ncbi:hypothetical protein [Methanobacterium sp.]|uniref:hypothetical protein n=1 Tax=Methanobacterium sp. TaxID=2164 RepID=UPI003C77B4C9
MSNTKKNKINKVKNSRGQVKSNVKGHKISKKSNWKCKRSSDRLQANNPDMIRRRGKKR